MTTNIENIENRENRMVQHSQFNGNVETGKEIPNNSNPNKKQIVGQALIELGEKVAKDETLYQRYHRLTRIINNKN